MKSNHSPKIVLRRSLALMLSALLLFSCPLTAFASTPDSPFDIAVFARVISGISYYIFVQPKDPDPEAPPVNITVPVRGDENVVHADVTIDHDEVMMHDLDFEEIDHVVGDHVSTGVVEVDLTHLEDEVTQLILPMITVTHIVEAAEEAHNDTESLQIDFPSGSVHLDDKVMRAMVEQAECNSVRLVLESVGTSRLNEKQMEAMDDLNVYSGYEACMVCVKAGKRISDFEGGVAELYVPLEIPEGLDAEKFHVWYVDDYGNREKLESWYEDGHLCFSVAHFSDFIVTYDGEELDAPNPLPPPTGDALLIYAAIALVSIVSVIIIWRLLGERRRRRT